MTYMMDDPGRFPRKHKIANIVAFSADLAKALGGTVAAPKEINTDTATIVIPDCHIEVRVTGTPWSEREAKRIKVSAFVPGIPHDDRPFPASTYGTQYVLPSITVGAERDIEPVARDIRNRVIDASVDPAAAWRAYAAQKSGGRDELRDAVTAIVQKFPVFEIGEQRRDTYRVPFSWYRAGEKTGHGHIRGKFVLSGFINADGSITVDRMESLRPALFDALVDVMDRGTMGPCPGCGADPLAGTPHVMGCPSVAAGTRRP